MKKFTCIIITSLFGLLGMSQTQIVGPIQDKTVLHPKYKQYWNFPDTAISYKGYAFVCKAHAHCIDSDSTHYAISVDGRFPSIKEKERTGFIVHETDDDLIVQARGGRQRVKGTHPGMARGGHYD